MCVHIYVIKNLLKNCLVCLILIFLIISLKLPKLIKNDRRDGISVFIWKDNENEAHIGFTRVQLLKFVTIATFYSRDDLYVRVAMRW